MDSKQHQRRAMRRAVARAVIIVAVAVLASPFAVSAQATTQDRATRPLFLAGVEKSRPLHEAASVGILFPVRPLDAAVGGRAVGAHDLQVGRRIQPGTIGLGAKRRRARTA